MSANQRRDPCSGYPTNYNELYYRKYVSNFPLTVTNQPWLFLPGQSWRVLKSWDTNTEKRFRRYIADGFNQRLKIYGINF